MPESLSKPCWSLTGTEARLNASIQASFDLSLPTVGLHPIVCDSTQWDAFRVLGVHTPSVSGNAGETLIDGHVRVNDLIATYAPTKDRNVQVQYDWRWLPEGTLGGIELLLSVQTDLLHSRPQLQTHSQFGPADVSWLTNTTSFRSIDRSLVVRPNDGTSLCLVRPHDHPGFSYAEMVHPSDFEQADLRIGGDGVELLYELFPDSLEKGVIRRARMRAFWLPRSGDERLACEKYGQLVSAAPRLTA